MRKSISTRIVKNQVPTQMTLALNPAEYGGSVSQRRSTTELVTAWSDRIAAPLIRWIAQQYSTELNTPAHFIEMLLLIEDKRFPFHFGVDPVAVCRAIIFNAKGCTLQGASTLNQQLYNVRHRGMKSRHIRRSYRRKIAQAWGAICMTFQHSRISLLKEYLDSIYWGGSITGLDEAARKYFGTMRHSLSPSQSFFLAERIAMPNRCSAARVKTLLLRPAIQSVLRRHRACSDDIIRIYSNVIGSGGELWYFREK